MEILCFVAGMLFFYKPNICVFLVLLACILFRPKVTIILAFFFALGWAYLHNMSINYKATSENLDGKTLIIQGQIVSVPKVTSARIQFILKTQDIALTLVNCYKNCANVEINQYIKAQIKFRKPRNYLNPGGFDYVEFLKARHIDWIGSCNNIKLLVNNKNSSSLSTVRNRLKNKLENIDLNYKTLAIIQALTIGVTNNLIEEDWKLFRRTGTIHLLVISGAHIGFVAGFVFYIANFLWSRVPRLSLLLPSISFGSTCAIIAAFSYALLAGFSVSVQRAFIACLLIFSRNFLQLKFTSWQIWRLALFVCLIYEPHYVLFPGFFLSFIAVAILFISSKYFITSNKFLKSIILQLACLIGLLPFTLYWFEYASINGFFANLIAIPLVGFIIVPFSLIFLISVFWINSAWLSKFVSSVVDLLYWYLNFIDKNLNFNLELHFTIYMTLTFILIVLIGLIYSVKSLRLSMICLCCSLILPKFNKLNENEALIDILDVGQGLAVLIKTAKHIVLYDTGGKFYHGKDLGELVIVPYLKILGIKYIDMLIVSHPDLDHRGGLSTIEKSFKVKKLVINDPQYYKRGYNCHNFPEWSWDGLNFKFLAIRHDFSKKNNDSCVLLLQNKYKRILLTGDIERDAEKYLIKNYSNFLYADYLVVPHHGSKTSSSQEFLQAVKPKFAIFSYGYKNRYHFPSSEIVARYNNLQIKTLNTATQGMVTVKLNG